MKDLKGDLPICREDRLPPGRTSAKVVALTGCAQTGSWSCSPPRRNLSPHLHRRGYGSLECVRISSPLRPNPPRGELSYREPPLPRGQIGRRSTWGAEPSLAATRRPRRCTNPPPNSLRGSGGAGSRSRKTANEAPIHTQIWFSQNQNLAEFAPGAKR